MQEESLKVKSKKAKVKMSNIIFNLTDFLLFTF